MAVQEGRSFEYTPTWVVASVCLVIVFISVAAERGLNLLGKKLFKHKNQPALFGALQKLKEELMLLGFISLLLTVSQGLIIHICLPEHLANIMLPCKPETAHHARRLLAEENEFHCSEGYVPFLSLEALHQLHIFIFVLAVVYVVFCALTTVLGGVKISQWTHWENSLEATHPRAHPHHIKEFLERTGKYWRKFCIISWVVAFLKQFYGSVTKSDYLAMRSGFILEYCPHYPQFNFQMYLLKTLEHDFPRISWSLWLFVVLFLIMNLAGWHTYFWLSFLPLILLLIVGAKLEHIITELAQRAELAKDGPERAGTRVHPFDELFWFGRPGLVLYLIHFILFQNSFEIAFILWIWVTYGRRSCIMEELGFIVPRVIVGIIVQLICSYSTLPLYALVSQMGSLFKEAIFDETTKAPLMNWVKYLRNKQLKRMNSHRGAVNRLTSESADSVMLAQPPVAEEEITTEIELSGLNISQMPSWNHC